MSSQKLISKWGRYEKIFEDWESLQEEQQLRAQISCSSFAQSRILHFRCFCFISLNSHTIHFKFWIWVDTTHAFHMRLFVSKTNMMFWRYLPFTEISNICQYLLILIRYTKSVGILWKLGGISIIIPVCISSLMLYQKIFINQCSENWNTINASYLQNLLIDWWKYFYDRWSTIPSFYPWRH